MSSMKSTNQQTEHHESLWYEDGNIILQAQCVLFKVHRGILARQSDFFKNMFTLPSSGQIEGTVARPLMVPEESSRGLAHLLMMLYTVSGYDLLLSDDEFDEVLLAAHRFQSHDVLEIVPRRMDARLPAERKLALGLQYDLEYWQLLSFQELVLSFRPRDATDKLGDAIWLKVFAARAQISQARIDHITVKLNWIACGHILAALVSSVPFSPPDEYRMRYQAYRYKGKTTHDCCKAAANFNFTGGPNDRMDTVLVPAATEHAVIAAVWSAV